MTDEKEVLAREVTVAQLAQDLAGLPQDAEVFVSVLGAGITIPIVGLAKFTTNDGKEIIVFSIPAQNTVRALELYQENSLKHAEAGAVN